MTSIFISYSHRDSDFARRLATDLRSHSLEVWLDEDELLIGDSMLAKISAGIGSSEYLAVLLSRASVESQWVKKEVEIALTEEMHRSETKVLPILLEDCDIPPYLSEKLYADFRDPKRYRESIQLLLKRTGAESYEVPAGEGVLVVYTGGGIGMQADEHGMFRPGRIEPLVGAVSLPASMMSLKVDYVSLSKPLDSVNIGPQQWGELASLIADRYHVYEGFVLLHGLDTISYTASALSFMIQNIAKPIILTGSSLPITDSQSNGRANLILAIRAAAARSLGNEVFRQVAICWDGKILSGVGADVVGLDRIQGAVIAEADSLGVVGTSNTPVGTKSPGALRLRTEVEGPVLWHLLPPIPPNFLEYLDGSKVPSAIILEISGSGDWIDNDRPTWLGRNRISTESLVLVMDSRRVVDDYNRPYKPVIRVLEDGLVFCSHIAIPTISAKILFLLAEYQDLNTVRHLLVTDMMGELHGHSL